MIGDHDIYWLTEPSFCKKNLVARIQVKWAKFRPQTSFFCHFLKFVSLVFFKIAYNDSLQQCITSSKSKTTKKKFGDQILAKTDQNQSQNYNFDHFLKFGSLVFLEIEYNDSLQQCMTSSRGKTHKKFGGTKFGSKRPKSGPNLGFFCHFLKFGVSVLL